MLPDAPQPPAGGAGDSAHPPVGLTSIAVLGSCVTRDVFNSRFNPGYRERYRVTSTGFRLSLPSVMSPPPAIDPALLDGPENAHQRERLGLEVSRAFLGEVAGEPPDLLLLDLCTDARFGVLDLGGGVYLTGDLGALRRTRWWQGLDPSRLPRVIRPEMDPATYIEVWDVALRRLSEFLARSSPRTRVVLVNVRPTDLLWLPGADAPVPLVGHRRLPRGNPARYTAVLADLQDRAAAATTWTVVDMSRRQYPTSDAHPWAAGPRHYAPDYYEDLLAALDALVSAPGDGHAITVTGGRGSPTPGRRWDHEPGRGEPRPRPPRRRLHPARRAWQLRRRAHRLALSAVRRLRGGIA